MKEIDFFFVSNIYLHEKYPQEFYDVIANAKK